MKKFYRNSENQIVFGLLAGLAEYFERDVLLVRVLYVMLTILTGFFPGIIAYLVGALMVPYAPVITPSTPVDDAAAV